MQTIIRKNHREMVHIILNRPSQLNSVTHQMCEELQSVVKDLDSKVLLISGAGRAFSAGGNLKHFLQSIENKHIDFSLGDECKKTVLAVNTTKSALVTVMNGFVMGIGAGFGLWAPIRVVTENARFAMPEVRVGLVPDAGAGHFLAKMPYNQGLLLGLTGNQIDGQTMCQLGLADFYIPSTDIEKMIQEISDSELLRDVNSIKDYFAKQCKRYTTQQYHPDLKLSQILGSYNYNHIVKEFKQHYPAIAQDILKYSPHAQQVLIELLVRNHPLQGLRENLILDHRILNETALSEDVHQGLISLFVDKNHKPKWSQEPVDLGKYFKECPREQIYFQRKENRSVNRSSAVCQSINYVEKQQAYQHSLINGSQYYGQVSNSKANGVGSCFFKTGAFYYGEWLDNEMHGYGIYFFDIGGYIRGHFSNGLADGQAELVYQNGNTYQGWFLEGRKHGSGVKKGRIRETVNYRDGVRVGGGEYEELDFVFYNQQSQNNILKIHLPCVFVHLDRVVYGLQCDLSGLGAMAYCNTRVDMGTFSNGVLNGRGRIIFKSGDIYDGQLIQGLFNGQGQYHNDEQVTIGQFLNNQLISIEKQERRSLQLPNQAVLEQRLLIKNVFLKNRHQVKTHQRTLTHKSCERQSNKVNQIQSLITHMLNPKSITKNTKCDTQASSNRVFDSLLSRVSSPKGRCNLESIICQVTSPSQFR